jgi:hypothetical protein
LKNYNEFYNWIDSLRNQFWHKWMVYYCTQKQYIQSQLNEQVCVFSFPWRRRLNSKILGILTFYVSIVFIDFIFLWVFFLSFLDEDFLGKKFWPFYFFGFYIFIVFIILIFLQMCVFSLILDEDLLGWKFCPFLMFCSSVIHCFYHFDIFTDVCFFLFSWRRRFRLKILSILFFLYVFIVFIVLIFLPINRVFTITSLLFILHIFSYLITYCLILRDYYMTFSILALVSAWDSHINPDSEAGGLIWVEGWYQGRYGKFHVIIYLSHILLWLLYDRKDLWTDKLRKNKSLRELPFVQLANIFVSSFVQWR